MAEKLLAINFGGIGDEILFLPVFTCIKESSPNTHITLLLEPRSKAIKDITNSIDDIKLFDIKKRPLLPWDYWQLLQILHEGNYQTVLSSGSSPLVACLLFASHIEKRIGYYAGPLSNFLLTNPVKLYRHQYAGNMYHDLVQGLGLKQKRVIPHAQIPTNNLSNMKVWLESHASSKGKNRKVLIHPGTSKLAIEKGIIKTWPAKNWAILISSLLKSLDTQVILAGGPDDDQTIQQINEELGKMSFTNMEFFISAHGITKSLADLGGLILLSDLLICVDSAPMHLAVALEKQVLALFGPTNPAHLLPVSPLCRYIKDKDIDHTRKPNTKLNSGINIQPNIVYQSALDLLQIVKVQ